MGKFRLPSDPPRALGGRIRKKKDKRPVAFEVQTTPGHLVAHIAKLVGAGKSQKRGTYKRTQARRIQNECRASVRVFTCPDLCEKIAARLRK